MTNEIIDAETEEFNIEISKMRNNPRDGSLRAVVEADYKDNDDIPPYDQEIKLSGSSVNRFAGTILEINDIEDDEVKSNLKSEILKNKKKAEELAKKRQKRINDEVNNFGDVEPEDELEEILAELYREDSPVTIDELKEDYPRVNKLQDQNRELVIRNGQDLLLTEKGEEKAEEVLGFDEFDGDVADEAIRQLDNDPLDYYLTAFNRMHKGDHLLKIWELVSALSATCSDRQVHSWAVGSSGKGKSALKRNLMKIMPDHYVQKITDFTPKAFIYEAEKEGADILNNQVVYFDEVDDMDEVVNLMRSITDQEEDVIEHKMVRDQEAHTLRLKVDSLTVWFTSVETVNDEQLKNRFILTNPDSSSDLDKKVFNHQQKHLHTGNRLDKPPREAPVVKEMVNNIISNTSDLTPIVPFKVNWKQKFNRRLYPYFVTLMGLIAKIHYRNRVIKDGNIYVTEADFHMSSLIWDRLIDTTVAQTDDESLRLLESLPENRAEAMSTSDLSMQLTGFSTTKIRDKIKALEETEELNLINKDRGDGNQYIYWAGEDKKRLVDNLPDIIIDRDIVNDMLEKSGIDPEDQIIDSVLASEINIYNRLEERFEDYKDRMDAKREKDELDVEITQPEKIFIEQAKEYEWMGDIDTLEQMSNKMDNAYEIAEQLEEKDIISIDGDNVPHPMAKYDQARQQGLIK